jgi:hypothetical protein
MPGFFTTAHIRFRYDFQKRYACTVIIDKSRIRRINGSRRCERAFLHLLPYGYGSDGCGAFASYFDIDIAVKQIGKSYWDVWKFFGKSG